jgi:hypothetical protein
MLFAVHLAECLFKSKIQFLFVEVKTKRTEKA